MFTGIFSLFSHFLQMILGISTQGTFPPPLSASEERACFLAMEKGDARAREKLILHNLRLVSHIVRKYYASAKNQEDLISIGNLGLIKAVDSFRVSNGARFATYAAKCIQNEILMHFRSQKKLSAEVSIHETIDVDRDGNPLTYMDVVCGDENIPEEIARKLSLQKVLRYIDRILDARERQVIRLRYGLGNAQPLTQRQVAERLGISRSYVSRIEKGAIEKLREEMGVRS